MSPRLLQWFGLLGAPLAWVAQFVFGYAITEAGCDPGSRKYGIPIDGWTTAATAAAATVGMTISVLFLFMILMGGLGAITLENCRQG